MKVASCKRGELLLATSNPAKAERLRWVFAGLGYDLVDLPPDAAPAPAEHEASFTGNAELKACYYSERVGISAAASDGGLLIPALGSRWNSVLTARSAGPEATDLDRARNLIELARHLVGDQRIVYWVEALALAANGRLLASWQAEGTTAYLREDFKPEELRPGFWAASLCLVPSLGRTLAQLGDDELGEQDQTWSRLRRSVRESLG